MSSNGRTVVFGTAYLGSNPGAGTIWVWGNGWPPALGAGSCRFDPCHPDSTGSALGCREVLQTTRGGFDSLAVHSSLSIGSNPIRSTIRPVAQCKDAASRLGCPSARTLDSKSGERGSTPRRPAKSLDGRLAPPSRRGLNLVCRIGRVRRVAPNPSRKRWLWLVAQGVRILTLPQTETC